MYSKFLPFYQIDSPSCIFSCDGTILVGGNLSMKATIAKVQQGFAEFWCDF